MVEWKKLGEICEILRGQSLSKNDIGMGAYPIILYGELYTTYGEYITSIKSSTSIEKAEKATKLTYNDLVLPISSTTKEAQIGKASVIKLNNNVSLGGDAIILRNSPNSDYLMYYINSTLFEKEKMSCVRGTTIMHLSPKDLAQKIIPLPSLLEQSHIVSILDTFTSSIANLKQQIEERRKQYEYERDRLLDLEGKEGVEMKMLGEIGNVCMCKRIMKEQTSDQGDIPFFKIGTFGGKADAYISRELFEEYKERYSYPKKGEILISAAGTIGRTVVFNGEEAYFQDSNIVWISNSEVLVHNSFLRYLYGIIDWKIDGGTIKRLYNYNLKNAVIPVPSLSDQQRIVSILDTFEASIKNLEEQLALREKQYEYYRNKLLTFE